MHSFTQRRLGLASHGFVLAIVNTSSRYLDQPDPAAAMRDAQKNPTDENIDTALAIFHAWRERDPEAALKPPWQASAATGTCWVFATPRRHC